METEIVVKDDLVEPSLHKYDTVRESRADLEPQESAGSNSFVSQPWTAAAASSGWEPDSVDSPRNWRLNDGEEVEQSGLVEPAATSSRYPGTTVEGRCQRQRQQPSAAEIK